MSLINDALRRAKDAQQQAPPPPAPDLPLRPVEPAQASARRGLGLLLPAMLVVVGLLALFVVWALVQTRGPARPIEVNARTARVARAIPAPQPASVPAAADATKPTGAAQPNRSLQPASSPSPATGPAATLAAATTSAAANAPVAEAQESEGTNTATLTAALPPKAAPLRLQAIVFNPRRPSAMISGKTLFVGDKLGDLRVVAIDQQSATLAGAGQTNVLSLAE